MNTQRIDLAVYSDATTLGGAEVNLARVLAALPERVRVTLIGVDDEVVDWLRGHRTDSRALTIPAISDRSDMRGMLRHRAIFKRLGADVMQFNLSTASSCQWAILVATTVPRLHRIVVENSPMGVWSATSGHLKRLTSKHLSAHVAVGERTARMIEESTGLPDQSIATLYHGVPDVGREPVTRSAAPTLLTVARHDPVKGIDILLDAFTMVEPPARLVLIGDGSETDNLKQQCHALGLDERVDFVSLPWESRAADLMWAYDALVLPSRIEGFPVTIAEAMLAGIPVVAADVGSVSEAVTPGETGWIVPPEDPSALAAALDELLSDRAKADAMGRNARRVAESRFRIDATVDAYLALYERILG